jgi:uncharacterized membrane protein YqjE
VAPIQRCGGTQASSETRRFNQAWLIRLFRQSVNRLTRRGIRLPARRRVAQERPWQPLWVSENWHTFEALVLTQNLWLSSQPFARVLRGGDLLVRRQALLSARQARQAHLKEAAMSHSNEGTDPSAGELVSQISAQVSRLVRDELRLAQVELSQKGKKAGAGAALFAGAGLLGWLGAGAVAAAAILGLANGVAAWLAALIVGVALLVIGGIAALLGKREVTQATPPVPQEAAQGIRSDIETVKGRVHR